MHVRCYGLPNPIQWQQPCDLHSFFFYAIIRTLRGSVMEETKRKYWEKEAIRISEMMHRGFYEKTIHPKDLDDYLSQESFSWIGAVEGENYLSKKDAITAFSRQRDLHEVPLISVGKGRYRVQWVSDTVLLVLSIIPLSTKKETGLLLSENQRSTMIFHIEKDALRIVHIHVSNPWSMMPDKKQFPRSQGRSNYEYVQQVLSEQTLSRYPDLSPRQKLILELLSQGKTYKAIAEALSISPRTVRYHVNELLTKFKVRTRAELLTAVQK